MKFRFRPRTGTTLQLKVKAEHHPRLLPLEISQDRVQRSEQHGATQQCRHQMSCTNRHSESAKPLGMKWKVATLAEAVTLSQG
jgi:hypothetical protein